MGEISLFLFKKYFKKVIDKNETSWYYINIERRDAKKEENKMTKRDLMKRGHQIARTLEGNYAARLSVGLKQAWEENKNPLNVVKSVLDETGIKYTANNWEKYGEKRIYVNLYYKNQTQKFYIDLKTKRTAGQSALYRHRLAEALGF